MDRRPSPPELPAAGDTGGPSSGGSSSVGPSAAGPGCDSFYTARDARNLRRVNLWLLAAALAYIGATAALRWRASIPGALPWLAAGVAWLLAVLVMRSYLVFWRAADELLRRVQTEALAIGFAAGAIFSLLYPLLEGVGAPELDRHGTGVVMMVTWGVASWLGERRYSGSSGA